MFICVIMIVSDTIECHTDKEEKESHREQFEIRKKEFKYVNQYISILTSALLFLWVSLLEIRLL
jgi:hypothetical protein